MNTKIITILIIGMVFTAGLMASFGIPAFAGDPAPGLDITIEQIPGGEVSTNGYISSLSTKSVALVRMEIGDVLLLYGVGGADINKVTYALEGSGVYKAELKSFLINIGIGEAGVNAVLTKLDELGTGFIKPDDSEKAISTSGTEDILLEGEEQAAATGEVKDVSLSPSDVSTAETQDDFELTKASSIQSEGLEEDTISTPDAGDTSRSATGCENDGQCSAGTVCINSLCIPPPPPQGGKDPLKGLNISRAKKYKSEISSGSDTGDLGDTTQEIDSFFDVYTELEVFIEVIADEANITKIEAGRVIDALMAVSPDFIIDENGLQGLTADGSIVAWGEAELIEVIASGANLTKADAERALDAFVEATIKSAPALYKFLISGERVALVGSGSFSISKRKARTGRAKYQNIVLKRSVFHDVSMVAIRNIISAAPKERDDLIDELRTSRGLWQTEILSMDLAIRDNAKDLRDNFRKATVTIKLRDDQGVAPKLCEAVCQARIANAHGKGLLLVYRYRSAIARFDDILKRIESRVARKQWLVSNFAVRISIEEVKNKLLENKATLEILTATYELLLEGENPQGIAEEASEIAKELKIEIKNLHAKLREIVNEIKNSIAINEKGLY